MGGPYTGFANRNSSLTKVIKLLQDSLDATVVPIVSGWGDYQGATLLNPVNMLSKNLADGGQSEIAESTLGRRGENNAS